jgi:hypothetical protein
MLDVKERIGAVRNVLNDSELREVFIDSLKWDDRLLNTTFDICLDVKVHSTQEDRMELVHSVLGGNK